MMRCQSNNGQPTSQSEHRFLSGTFFAILSVLATQKDIPSLLSRLDLPAMHIGFTIVSLTLVAVAFAFSTFAYGLSAGCFRKGVEKEGKSAVWEERARTAFSVGADFFRVGYIMMMPSLSSLLAFAHWLLGLAGLLTFIVSWIVLIRRTKFPYKNEQ